MAEVTITIDNNEMHYDAKECNSRDFTAIINASLHHMELEREKSNEDITHYLDGIKKNLEKLNNL